MTRSCLPLAFALGLSISAGMCQPPSPPAPKPLRERLLERAQKGDAEAQFELGKNYETGRIGLHRDLAQARHWYREAADQGDPFAQASLAIFFHFGKGVPRDPYQAYFWYSRAVSGLTGADRDTVAEMRDRLTQELTPNQMIEAQRLAETFHSAQGVK